MENSSFNAQGYTDPEVCLLDCINELELRIRNKIENYMVCYYNARMKCYVYVGIVN
jgi:hypothetical protein